MLYGFDDVLVIGVVVDVVFEVFVDFCFVWFGVLFEEVGCVYDYVGCVVVVL